jgi:hypothetical protein
MARELEREILNLTDLTNMPEGFLWGTEKFILRPGFYQINLNGDGMTHGDRIPLPIVQIGDECLAYVHPGRPDIIRAGAKYLAEAIENLGLAKPILVTPASDKSIELMKAASEKLDIPLLILPRTTDKAEADRLVATPSWADGWVKSISYTPVTGKLKYMGITREQKFQLLGMDPVVGDDIVNTIRTVDTVKALMEFVGAKNVDEIPVVVLGYEGNGPCPRNVHAAFRLRTWNKDEVTALLEGR